MTMHKFTVFCRQTNDSGTTFITTVEVPENDATLAGVAGRADAGRTWEMRETEIKVIGIIVGDVEVSNWEEENGIDLPAPKVLNEIRIEINAFPGCGFPGAKLFAIEGEALDCDEELGLAMVEPGDLLDDADIGDDPMGQLSEQVHNAVKDMLDFWDRGIEPKSKSLVLNAGRFKLDKDGDPTEEIDETFDITVDIVPRVEEATGDEPL
jgi:hypothetical protein